MQKGHAWDSLGGDADMRAVTDTFAERQMQAGRGAGPGAPAGTPWQEGGGQHKGEAKSSAPSIMSTPGTSLKRQLSGLQ